MAHGSRPGEGPLDGHSEMAIYNELMKSLQIAIDIKIMPTHVK